MRKKLWLRIGIGLISGLLIIVTIASFFFYNLAIERNSKDFLQGNADLKVSAEAMDVFLEGEWRDWVRDQTFENIEMESFDGLTLQGYFLEAEEPTNTTVVTAHGYLGQASDTGLFGEYYYEELGYNFFTADARGHGESDGDYIGFGWHDRLDYVDWVNLLVDKLGSESEIILHGLSMGAATMLMTSGESLPSNVKGIIADSPYTSVHDLFAYQLSRMFHLPAFPILNTTSLVTNMKADYSLKEASALDQVKQTDIPILYIHGEADTFVPTNFTYELYEHTNSEADMVTFKEANHGEAFVIGQSSYIEKLNEFLEKHLD